MNAASYHTEQVEMREKQELPLLPRRKRINLAERTKRKRWKDGRRKAQVKAAKGEREKPEERKRIIFVLCHQNNEAKG